VGGTLTNSTGRKMFGTLIILKKPHRTHKSSAPTKMGNILLYGRNKGAMAKVYSEVASTQAEQSSGEHG
jgi:hypothetical protein